MFTVKHQDNHGNVWIKECHDVAIEATFEMVWVRLKDESGREIAFRNGWPVSDKSMDIIYIMNANGATIHSLRLRVSAACAFGCGEAETDDTSARLAA